VPYRLTSRLLFLSLLASACAGNPSARDRIPVEPSIEEVRQALAAGRYDLRALESHYTNRIAAIDRRGPTLNSIEINPEAATLSSHTGRSDCI
jgi:hypothetical protein